MSFLLSNLQVASNEEGLRSSWFTGTVLQIVNDQALVRYDELLEDDGEACMDASCATVIYLSMTVMHALHGFPMIRLIGTSLRVNLSQ